MEAAVQNEYTIHSLPLILHQVGVFVGHEDMGATPSGFQDFQDSQNLVQDSKNQYILTASKLFNRFE